jgi:Cdc6-like AAA superfamily ATPase
MQVHTNYSCEFCPPQSFTSHGKCHKNIVKFIEQCNRIRSDCENFRPDILFKISQWTEALAVVCETSQTNEDFEQFGNRLKQFNKTIDIIFKRKNQTQTSNIVKKPLQVQRSNQNS